ARDAARLREEVPEGLGQVRHQVGERVDELAADLDVHGDDARAYRVDDVDRVLLVLEPGRGGVGRLHRALGGHVGLGQQSGGGESERRQDREEVRACASQDEPLPFASHVLECRPRALAASEASLSRMRAPMRYARSVPDLLDELASNLLWRIGRASDDGPVTVRVGLASSAALFGELPRLRSATDAEVEAAVRDSSLRVEWVGP